MKQFLQALALEPQRGEYYHYLGLAQEKQGLRQDARESFLRSIEVGGPLGSHLQLARIYLAEGESAKAADELNLVRMLDLAGIEPLADRRSDRDPLVVAGGPVTFLNPEPIAQFVDVVAIGEAEALLPVLTDIAVDFGELNVYEQIPETLPDLLAERPLIVFGKWRGATEGRIALSGTGGGGSYTQTFDAAQTQPSDTNRPLRYLWARSRIARLSDFNPDQGNPENQAEITSLGLTYSLLTAYTSFIAVNDVIRNPEGSSEDIDQPLPLPLHVSNLAVGGSVSSVPEPEMALLLALGVLMLAWMFFYKNWKIRRLMPGSR